MRITETTTSLDLLRWWAENYCPVFSVTRPSEYHPALYLALSVEGAYGGGTPIIRLEMLIKGEPQRTWVAVNVAEMLKKMRDSELRVAKSIPNALPEQAKVVIQDGLHLWELTNWLIKKNTRDFYVFWKHSSALPTLIRFAPFPAELNPYHSPKYQLGRVDHEGVGYGFLQDVESITTLELLRLEEQDQMKKATVSITRRGVDYGELSDSD